jgi:hypothetical protein
MRFLKFLTFALGALGLVVLTGIYVTNASWSRVL